MTTRRRGRAVWAAYSDTGALAVSCPHCDAEAGAVCTKPDGRISKVPCVDRIAATAVIAPITRVPIPTRDSGPTDFSEPRRMPTEETP